MEQGRRPVRPADSLIGARGPAMAGPRADAPGIRFFRDPKWRGIAAQVLLCAALILLAYGAIHNAAENLARAKIASGFGFWNVTAGFDISQTLIDYDSQTSTYGRAFWVGLFNTLLVAMLGIVFATIIGFTIGIARLSSNFLVKRLAAGYVELIRNVPLLLQLLFWYNAVLKALPDIAMSLALPGGVLLNNRGLFLPRLASPGSGQLLVLLGSAIVAAIVFNGVGARTTALRDAPATRIVVAMTIVLAIPAVAWFAMGGSLSVEYPQVGRFNVRGGIEVLPELVALLLGLSIYTAAFIAEVVRAGLMSVSRGQIEAAKALGLRPAQTLRLVVIPQAMRVIIPPLSSQYLNLTKNSSLAVAIGYPDLVQIFAGTVLNITGQAIEVIVLTMAVYLGFSLITSLLMNIYNARFALVER
jgi:general L-amino acid transport system permease protein